MDSELEKRRDELALEYTYKQNELGEEDMFGTCMDYKAGFNSGVKEMEKKRTNDIEIFKDNLKVWDNQKRELKKQLQEAKGREAELVEALETIKKVEQYKSYNSPILHEINLALEKHKAAKDGNAL